MHPLPALPTRLGLSPLWGMAVRVHHKPFGTQFGCRRVSADVRVVWASRAAELMAEARQIRELRDRNTGPRDVPEPLPEAYELCLAEAAVFASLATVSDAVAAELAKEQAE